MTILEKFIYKTETIAQNVFAKKQDTLTKLFNLECNEQLLDIGFPCLKNNIRIVPSYQENMPSGFYNKETRKITLYYKPNTILSSYLKTAYHETGHLIEHFIVKNNLDFHKIMNLSQKQFECLLKNHFGEKYDDTFPPDIEKFKKFCKQNPFLQKEVFNTFVFDYYFYSNKPNIFYDANLTELHAEWFVYNIFKNKHLENNLPKTETDIVAIKSVISFAFRFKMKDITGLMLTKKQNHFKQILFSNTPFKSFVSVLQYSIKNGVDCVSQNTINTRLLLNLSDKINKDLTVATLYDIDKNNVIPTKETEMKPNIEDLDTIIQGYEIETYCGDNNFKYNEIENER